MELGDKNPLSTPFTLKSLKYCIIIKIIDICSLIISEGRSIEHNLCTLFDTDLFPVKSLVLISCVEQYIKSWISVLKNLLIKAKVLLVNFISEAAA